MTQMEPGDKCTEPESFLCFKPGISSLEVRTLAISKQFHQTSHCKSWAKPETDYSLVVELNIARGGQTKTLTEEWHPVVVLVLQGAADAGMLDPGQSLADHIPGAGSGRPQSLADIRRWGLQRGFSRQLRQKWKPPSCWRSTRTCWRFLLPGGPI